MNFAIIDRTAEITIFSAATPVHPNTGPSSQKRRKANNEHFRAIEALSEQKSGHILSSAETTYQDAKPLIRVQPE